MTTGLTIRDFFKAYREVRYADSGSIRLTEIEHNAYLNRLTIEVTHYDAQRAINYKTLPENTHWGYCTSFKGSSVVDNTPVKFAKQRVFELINQGIWAYHSASESTELTRNFAESAGNSVLQSELLEAAQSKTVDFYLDLIGNLPGQIEEDLKWILSFTYRPGDDPESPKKAYTAFPLASPFPDVFKFKSDIPLSFLLRLESWYLVNPAVYITSNPTDTSDETEDESEYPSPESGDGSGGGEEFPTPSEPDPSSDPRDFTGGDYGDQGTWTVQLEYFDAGNNPPCNDVPIRTQTIAGYSKTKPYLDVVSGPGPFGAPSVDLVTALQRIRVANDCGVELLGEPTFSPGQVIFP